LSFTYDFVSQPLLSQVRLLIPDTDPNNAIFQDDEVNQAIYIESAQGLYASGQAVSGGVPVVSPGQVYSIRRAAALLVDCIAGSNAKLAIIANMLDVKLDGASAAAALHDHAEALRTTEATSGAFAIAEWVVDPNTAYERVWKQMLRLYPG
jgi:hypothetical protein